MSTDRLQRALDIFERVCDLDNETRTGTLDTLCGGDPELRVLVEQMLERDADDQPGALSDPGVGAALLAAEIQDGVPERIGAYTIIREVGRGGMGIVYEAEQSQPKRRVALKVIRDGFGSVELRRRFAREAEVLGRLHHPGIAHVYEAGTTEIGSSEIPFFAMEFIEGERLDTFVRERNLAPSEILRIFLPICDAVQYAHQNGVIHRDLKPGNILVSQTGTAITNTGGTGSLSAFAGQPKILDFGVARLSDPDSQMTVQTVAGQIVGTLAYMSPEQLDGDPVQIDARVDVYALGALLYELLAGRQPFDTAGKPIAEVARIVRDTDPPLLGSHDRALRGDIESMVAKAIEPGRDRRYRSAAELGEDIRRFLADEPIRARRAGTVYQFQKFAQRNRALVGGVAASFVLLAAGIAGTSVGLVSALDANEKLAVQNDRLEQVAAFQAAQLSDVDPEVIGADLRGLILGSVAAEERDAVNTALRDFNPTTAILDLLDSHLFDPSWETIREDFGQEPELSARLLHALADTASDLGLPERALEIAHEAHSTRIELEGAASERALETASLIGNIMTALDDPAPALEWFNETVPLIETRFGGQSIEALEHEAGRAALLVELDRLDQAIEVLEPALETMTSRVGRDDPKTLSVLYTLSRARGERGDYEVAFELISEVVEGRKRVLGDEDRRTLTAMGSYAVWLSRLGRFEESAEAERELLDIRRRTLGDRHPDTLTSIANYAAALDGLSRFDDAEVLAREAVEGVKATLGPYSAGTLSASNTLASIVQSLGRVDEAVEIYREVIAARTETLGATHTSTLIASSNLASAFADQGRLDDAMLQYKAVYEGFRESRGDDHSYTLRSLGNYASVLIDMERYDDAIPLLERNLEGRIEVLGPEHPSTANAIYTLGRCLLNAGRPGDAEQHCVRALELYEAVSPEHIGTLYSLGLVARLRVEQGHLDAARVAYQETINRRERVLGADHALTVSARNELAALDADG